jgi:hypothetical protein
MDALSFEGVSVSGPTTARPAIAPQGQFFFDTTLGQWLVWDDAAVDAVGGWRLASGVVCEEVLFTEAGAAGVYTGSVNIPAGATIHDIIVNGVALWGAGSSATLKVGDATDDDGFYTGVNLKATDLLAGESISFALAGGKAGAYIANSQVSPRYSATARVISGVVTTVGTTASTGVTRMQVVYALPRVKSATKA